MMEFETELRERLHAGVDRAAVDLDTLIAGGVAQGKQFARRRRLTQLVAVAATIAVIGSAAAYAGSLLGPAGHQFGPAAQTTATPSQTSPMLKTLTPQAALQLLLEQLPPDGKTDKYTGGSNVKTTGPGEVWISLSYTDPQGPSNLSLAVMPEPIPLSCAGQSPQCSLTTLPNGSKLLLKETVSPDGSDLRTRQAHLVRKDGLYISLISDNATKWKDKGTRPLPPLSLAELRTIVTSPHWRLSVDAALVDESNSLFVPRPTQTISDPPAGPTSPSGSPS
jgi:hypothetical protein